MESQTRSNAEKIVIGLLIAFGVAVMIGIQSLFLTHVAQALPQDPIWRFVTILCFMAPPVMVGLLSVFKLNYSRSSAQDWILICGMGIELLLFMVNVIVAVNGTAIEDNMLGVIGIILGGTAGIVSVGTVAFTLAADPVRGVQKAEIESQLSLIRAAQAQNQKNVLAAMTSDRVRERTERGAEVYVMQQFGRMLGQQLTSNHDAVQPKTVFIQPPETGTSPAPQRTAARSFDELLANPAFVEQLIARVENTKANGGTYHAETPPPPASFQ
jgi:hypothetical protein